MSIPLPTVLHCIIYGVLFWYRDVILERLPTFIPLFYQSDHLRILLLFLQSFLMLLPNAFENYGTMISNVFA